LLLFLTTCYLFFVRRNILLASLSAILSLVVWLFRNGDTEFGSAQVKTLSREEAIYAGKQLEHETCLFRCSERRISISTKGAGTLTAAVRRLPHKAPNCHIGLIFTHPWAPLGGDMNNNVPTVLSELFASAGYTTLRFNFRGFGVSRGSSEVEDIRAAAQYLLTLPETAKGGKVTKVVVVGYSYGSLIAQGAAQVPEVSAVAALSCPFSFANWLTLFNDKALLGRAQNSNKPKMFVMGTQDNFVSAASFRKRLSAYSQPCTSALVDSCDHFWFDTEIILFGQVGDWLRSLQF